MELQFDDSEIRHILIKNGYKIESYARKGYESREIAFREGDDKEKSQFYTSEFKKLLSENLKKNISNL